MAATKGNREWTPIDANWRDRAAPATALAEGEAGPTPSLRPDKSDTSRPHLRSFVSIRGFKNLRRLRTLLRLALRREELEMRFAARMIPQLRERFRQSKGTGVVFSLRKCLLAFRSSSKRYISSSVMFLHFGGSVFAGAAARLFPGPLQERLAFCLDMPPASRSGGTRLGEFPVPQ